ncbi:hypothetical protein CR513_42938, partial [Mucuna pruriens]
MFEEDDCAQSIPVLYMVVDVDESYNIIVGQLALNKLGAVVSTLHLCMKFLVGRRVGNVWADFWLAQHCYEDGLRIGPSATHKRKIGTMLGKEEESLLTHFLMKNRDMFAWTLYDMPGIDPSFMCHYLSIVPGAKPIAQKKWK